MREGRALFTCLEKLKPIYPQAPPQASRSINKAEGEDSEPLEDLEEAFQSEELPTNCRPLHTEVGVHSL